MSWQNVAGYWTRQFPVAGHILGLYDNWRYARDYEKNTGYRARYPGRAWGSGGISSVIQEGASYGRMLNKIYN